MKVSILSSTVLLAKTISAASSDQETRVFVKETLQSNSLANIYLEYGSQVTPGEATLSYGSCKQGDSAQNITQLVINEAHESQKVAWHVPADAETGCFFVNDTLGNLIIKSKPHTVNENYNNRSHSGLYDLQFDAIKYHQSDRASNSSVATSKDKKIGIVGAGSAGLFSGFLLDQAGFHNYEILEANSRVGGRLHTVHFDDSGTVYQEMGGMRLPIEYHHNGKTLPINDHKIVFQVSEELNALNEKSHKIEFIDWYQKRSNNLYYKNGFRLADGRIPTVGEVKQNPSLVPDGPDVSELTKEINKATSEFLTEDWFKLIASDLYAAHAKAIEEGYEDWSEFSWLHNKMDVSLNATLYETGPDIEQIWRKMYDDFIYNRPTNWKTVQGGLDRIPRAFEPLMRDRIAYGKRVSKLDYKDDKVSVQWKDSPLDRQYQSKEYDNVVVAVPFSVVRTWKLPQLDFLLNEAIHKLRYSFACKAALLFSERFWEHLDRPIEGGCDQTDLFSGQICYPANNFGSEGTGAVLASYVEDNIGLHTTSMTEEQYVGRVLEDFTELHGNLVDKYYTGNYTSYCWHSDPSASGSWARPSPGQNKMYTPSYYKINNGLVFVGDHTDVKHVWISAAFDSAIRGVVMILIENGHVDEAKDIVKKYNARWLRI